MSPFSFPKSYRRRQRVAPAGLLLGVTMAVTGTWFFTSTKTTKPMTRFMFAFTWKEAPDPLHAEAEHAQVEKLIAEQRMEQMFLAADRSRGWLVMRDNSEQEAAQAVATLPFYPVMHVEPTQLLDQYP